MAVAVPVGLGPRPSRADRTARSARPETLFTQLVVRSDHFFLSLEKKKLW